MLDKSTRTRRLIVSLLGGGFALSVSVAAHAFTVDGSGHYAVRGEWQNNPGMNGGTGLHQAIAQSCRLLGEARANDKGSFFLELRIFEPNGQTYWGDTPRSSQCRGRAAGDGDCLTPYQSTLYPDYEPHQAKITQAYARYAFDYFILEAGRRSRSWGLGMFLNAGEDMFAPRASIFDGITLNVNLQQYQTLGFSLGYDKLTETGAPVRDGLDTSADPKDKYGPTNGNDDVDQVFLSISYDDRQAYAGSTFTKEIGIYAARVHSGDVDKGGSSTDLTYLDIFANFNIASLIFKHETLITLGKSADPNLIKLGGSYFDSNSDVAVNKLNTFSFAGSLTYSLSRSGSFSGPPEFLEGDMVDHSLFAQYAYAPGDEEGYYNDRRILDSSEEDDHSRSLGIAKRQNNRARAMALHPSFRPALILFNGREYLRDLAIDGIFDPGQLMNAQLYAAGYRYENLSIGQIELKAIYARMNQGIPAEVLDYYQGHGEVKRPVGFAGKSLGLEMDVTYTRKFGKNFSYGLAAGYLFAGKAWETIPNESARNSFLGQTFLGFNF